MVRDAQRGAPHHEGQQSRIVGYSYTRTSFLRPFHHSPIFQLTQVPSARLRPTTDPQRSAATCNTAVAMPSPTSPEPLFASAPAVAAPPMRGRWLSLLLG